MSDDFSLQFPHRPRHHWLVLVFWKPWRRHLRGNHRASTLSWLDAPCENKGPSGHFLLDLTGTAKQVLRVGRAGLCRSANIASVSNVSDACALPRHAENAASGDVSLFCFSSPRYFSSSRGTIHLGHDVIGRDDAHNVLSSSRIAGRSDSVDEAPRGTGCGDQSLEPKGTHRRPSKRASSASNSKTQPTETQMTMRPLCWGSSAGSKSARDVAQMPEQPLLPQMELRAAHVTDCNGTRVSADCGKSDRSPNEMTTTGAVGPGCCEHDLRDICWT